MVATSKCGEDDTQSRQPISKRFSKAVNVVPRLRFFKPRPNVPSSKRPESNITKVVSFQPEHDLQKTQSTDDVSASLLSEKSVSPSASTESSDVLGSKLGKLNTDTTIKNTIQSPLKGKNTFQTTEKENEVNLIIEHNSDKNDTETTNTKSSETHKRCSVQTTESIDDVTILSTSFLPERKLSTNESAKQSESTEKNSDNSDVIVENVVQNLNEENIYCAIREEIGVNVRVSKQETSKPADAESPETREGCDLQRTESADDVAIIANSLLSENNLPTSTSTEPSKSIIQSKPDKLNSEIVQSSLDKENIPQAIEKVNDINATVAKQDSCKSTSKTPNIDLPEARKRTSQVEGKNDTPHNVTNNIADKISKYPHLTSILSKKRAEPKRDVTYRKRKKYKKGDTMPERSKMTIADLIYWNPVGTDSSAVEIRSETTSSQNYDDPAASVDDEPEEMEAEEQDEEEVCNNVPKLFVSEDGQISIDELSLVATREKLPKPKITIESNEETTYSSYRRRPMTKQWNAKDTTIFYKALSLVGTDFGLMEKLFPHRTRRELKLKFKREERFNIQLVNRAMYESHLTFDADNLEEHIKNLNALCADVESMRENKHPSVRGRKPGRKSKTSTEKKKKSDQTDISENNIEGVKGIVSNKRKRAKSDKSISSEPSEPQELIEHQVADECVVNFKRQRKAKKLPEDFICTDDLDEVYYLDSNQDVGDETECTKEGEESSSVSINSEADNAVFINGNAVDNTVVFSIAEETNDVITNSTEAGKDVIIDNEAAAADSTVMFPVSEISKSSESIFTNSVSGMSKAEANAMNLGEIKEVRCNLSTIPEVDKSSVEPTESVSCVVQTNDLNEDYLNSDCEQDRVAVDITGMVDVDSLSNVMANEIVSSEVKSKRKNNKAYKLSKLQAEQDFVAVLRPSSTNYTPADETGEQIPLKFNSKSNQKTYSKSPESKRLITSLQAPFLSPDHSSAQTLLTRLNMSDSQPIAIPMIQEGESASNPVMIFAPQLNGNTIHLYMYNNQQS